MATESTFREIKPGSCVTRSGWSDSEAVILVDDPVCQDWTSTPNGCVGMGQLSLIIATSFVQRRFLTTLFVLTPNCFGWTICHAPVGKFTELGELP